MAKKKFCVVVGHLAYGSRDEILGMRYGKPHCFRKARQARAFARAVNRSGNDWDGPEAKLCGRACPAPKRVVKLTPRERRRAEAARRRRDANMIDIPF